MPIVKHSEQLKADFRFINQNLMESKEHGGAAAMDRAIKRMISIKEFAIHLSKRGKLPDTPTAFAWEFIYFYLYQRDYVAVAHILWIPETFTCEPHSVEMIWNGLFNHNLINVMGAASSGKTFSPAAWVLIDWILDPLWTRIELTSNSEDHVKKNLFADIVRLHGEAALQLPGSVDSESISLDKKRGMGFFILTIPGGPRTRGKLKGAKVKARPAHPIFGRDSRLRVILDEAQEVQGNIWDEVPNLLASVGRSTEHIKVLAAANPKLQFSRYGMNCKPNGGWEAIADDQDEWESETGWHVISINALRSENYLARKKIFPRMIDYDGVQKIIKACGGNAEHPNCYTLLYGRFPKSSLMGTVIKVEHVNRSQGEWVFEGRTRSLAANDPAYTGDDPSIANGRVGKAIAWIDFNGMRHDLPAPKTAIQVDAVGVLDRGDTQAMASDILERCRILNVSPGGFGIDRTGIGQGVHDIVRRQWKGKVGDFDGPNELPSIVGIHYSEKPTKIKVCEEDTETPAEMYDIVATELYYAAGKLIEHDYVRFGKGVPNRVYEELTGRMGGMQVGLGRKLTLESKSAFKSRTGSASPDMADVTTVLIHVARVTTATLVVRAKETKPTEQMRRSEPWSGFDQQFAGADLDGFGVTPMENLTVD